MSFDLPFTEYLLLLGSVYLSAGQELTGAAGQAGGFITEGGLGEKRFETWKRGGLVHWPEAPAVFLFLKFL